MSKLSHIQQTLLDFIRNYIEEHQRPPTYAEMQTVDGLSSKSHVDYHLKALSKKGYIERESGVSRGIRVTAKGRNGKNGHSALPIYGYIGASLPTWSATQNDIPDEVLHLSPDLIPNRPDLYGLRVRGDSMIDALVNDGDIVIMQPYHGEPIRNGTMAAVWLNSTDETTLKHFYRAGNRVKLVPANPFYDVIEVPAAEVEVQGQVVAVIRQY